MFILIRSKYNQRNKVEPFSMLVGLGLYKVQQTVQYPPDVVDYNSYQASASMTSGHGCPGVSWKAPYDQFFSSHSSHQSCTFGGQGAEPELRTVLAFHLASPSHRTLWLLLQIALTCTQIWWTTEVGIAFSRLEEGYENAIKDYNKKQVHSSSPL